MSGTVVEFVITDLEAEHDLDLAEEIFGELDDEFAIVADSVEYTAES